MISTSLYAGDPPKTPKPQTRIPPDDLCIVAGVFQQVPTDDGAVTFVCKHGPGICFYVPCWILPSGGAIPAASIQPDPLPPPLNIPAGTQYLFYYDANNVMQVVYFGSMTVTAQDDPDAPFLISVK
jgi:hypothetical protein